MKSWKLQDAQNHLSQIIKEAILQGPQEIFLNEKSSVIVLSKKEFDKLSKTKLSFLQFIRQSPLVNTKIKLTRSRVTERKVDL